MNMLGSIPHQNSVFIIYLLEDEQELSLGMLDMSPTYLYFLIVPYAILLSTLDVLYALICYFMYYFWD